VGSEEGSMRGLALACVLVLAACTPGPVPKPVPTPMGDAGGSCITACNNLAALGCAEGAPDAGCVAVCNHSSEITNLPLDCLASAASKDEARGCDASVKCP
jgi:hypothetical protein